MEFSLLAAAAAVADDSDYDVVGGDGGGDGDEAGVLVDCAHDASSEETVETDIDELPPDADGGNRLGDSRPSSLRSCW